MMYDRCACLCSAQTLARSLSQAQKTQVACKREGKGKGKLPDREMAPVLPMPTQDTPRFATSCTDKTSARENKQWYGESPCQRC